MTSLIYICPKGGERAHKPGTCKRHNVALEKRCAHCGNRIEDCICN